MPEPLLFCGGMHRAFGFSLREIYRESVPFKLLRGMPVDVICTDCAVALPAACLCESFIRWAHACLIKAAWPVMGVYFSDRRNLRRYGR